MGMGELSENGTRVVWYIVGWGVAVVEGALIGGLPARRAP